MVRKFLYHIYDAAIAKTTSSDRKIGGLLQSANQRLRKMSEHLDIETVTGKYFLGCNIRTFYLKNKQNARPTLFSKGLLH